MKINDLIVQYPIRNRQDAICRLRTFVNRKNQIIALVTDLDEKNTSASITNSIEHLYVYLSNKGYIFSETALIEHYESEGRESFDLVRINKDGTPEWEPLTREQVLELLGCVSAEFNKITFHSSRLMAEIEQLRYKIDPHIDFPDEGNKDKIKRTFEIQKKLTTKKSLQSLVESGTNEGILQKYLKKDLSIFAEVYAKPEDEYICFSEFPIDSGFIDFVLFTGRSRMDVLLIEVKGADFYLVNAGNYNKLSSKIEKAADQIRNRLRYIYENYETFRAQVHKIKEMVESGDILYNSFLGPSGNLQVDAGKDIKIQSIIIGGISRDNYIESKKRHDYEQNSIKIMIESWDSFLRKLRRH